MANYVLDFAALDRTSLASVGGKGANLGELGRIPGVRVPEGFCVTTDAFAAFVGTSREYAGLVAELAADDASPASLRAAGQRLRSHLETLAVPASVAAAIVAAWNRTGSGDAYAVRSSATAEDLPGASFAGQQDTYLNIRGENDLLESVRRCWASLFTDRAIAYRRQNGFEHAKVLLAVVVQRMVLPAAAGIMFTADPVNGNRTVVSIDAGPGLGEALVSGIMSADLYQVKDDKVVKKQIAVKKLAVYAKAGGGTRTVTLDDGRQTAPTLTDDDALRLARLGRRIERHFGSPQDIEWCLDDGKIYVVQSRPITTLYPVPPAGGDALRLFLSIGHPQMMTDAMKPLGLSVLRTLVPFGKEAPTAESGLLLAAGSRPYLDVTPLLAYREARRRLPGLLSLVDEQLSGAVREFIAREKAPAAGGDRKFPLSLVRSAFPTAFAIVKTILYGDTRHAIDEMNRFIAVRVRENRVKLQAATGAERITRIQEILSALLPAVFSYAAPYMGPALITYKLIARLAQKWLGDTAELGDISKSPLGNVTSELGLALGDLADAVRGQPAVGEYLRRADDETFLAGLAAVPGGDRLRPEFLNFFARYGMRGPGEIDITRPRWRETPTQLVPALLSHIAGLDPGQHRRDFLAGREQAEAAVKRLLDRLRQTPAGLLKARRMRRLIEVHRSLIGVREHPKYFLVQNLDLVKQALLSEAAELAAAGVLAAPEEIFWLTLPEIKEAVATRRVDRAVLAARRESFAQDAKLAPPRAITSEGELITARPAVSVPPGALAGSAVSAGAVQGRARVITSLADATMAKGDILVAPYTDPGWTPLFPLAAGLVTEVGGLMTHGAVVAREYGIPAVVGVDNATRLIKDGQQIVVDGSRGFVEIIRQ